jgi:hypothetical protein
MYTNIKEKKYDFGWYIFTKLCEVTGHTVVRFKGEKGNLFETLNQWINTMYIYVQK